MISFFEAAIRSLSIHRLGNRLNDEGYVLSEAPLAVEDELLGSLLMQYFVTPFTKTSEMYRFYHASDDLNLNALYHFAETIFENPDTFHEGSRQIAKYLYEAAAHPKIKGGELYVALFRNLQIEGELLDALGIFKSETKETYLKVSPRQDGFGLAYDSEGIDIRKLDKGCLVFNTEKEQGYKVAVVDNTNRGSNGLLSDVAVYWKDDFLKLKVRNDNYHQTNNVLGIYKNFVTQKIDQEFEVSKADKIDLLNRSMKYFKENENFDLGEFGNEVIGNEQGIASFLKYKKVCEDEFESPIPDTFDISSAAVKKQNRVYKSVLKLDKNFHIYIHGNKELIEKGFDEGKGMSFYKVWFKEEV
ncbi:MAG: nucleoid-associated protein [Bacteroidetes bacterium]|nr:nucleoid-associated protein [Bacteroidota bacterium]